MKQVEEDIKFIQIGKENSTGTVGVPLHPEPISGNYESLYEELIDRCDPANFLEPYDSDKIDIANRIYKQIVNYKEDNGKYSLKDLRKEAIEKLGVKFSTRVLYDHLTETCFPKRFTGAYYNYEHIKLANKLYSLILENADNIVVLEEIEKQASELPDIKLTPSPNPIITESYANYLYAFIIIVVATMGVCFLAAVLSSLRS